MRLLISLFLCLFAFAAGRAQTTPELDVMPMPAKVQMGSGQFLVDQSFTIGIAGAKDTRIEHAAERFVERLARQTAIPFKATLGGPDAKLVLNAQKADNNLLALGSDESYVLEVS